MLTPSVSAHAGQLAHSGFIRAHSICWKLMPTTAAGERIGWNATDPSSKCAENPDVAEQLSDISPLVSLYCKSFDSSVI